MKLLLTCPIPIHKSDSLMFVADLSYRLRNRTGGSVSASSAVLRNCENMVRTPVALEILAGLEGGPTKIKWSRKA